MEAAATGVEPGSASLSARSALDRRVEGGASGQGLADYELGRALGKGKFATVFRATRRADGLDVALKRVSVDRMDAKARNKALKEVRLVAALNHPNVVQYHDSFLEGEELVMVLEWAPAGDLKRQIRKAQERGVHFDERTVWKYFAQVADALAHMHERRIMHRDLKPANVFLTLNGTVKVRWR
jgi:NIMA (never in mitosis gene a)-related kinase